MRIHPFRFIVLVLCFLLPCSVLCAVDLPLVPYPHKVSVKTGTLPLTAQKSIAVGQKDWKPLAELFAQEIQEAFGLKLIVVEGAGKRGDIVLKLDEQLGAEEYKIEVGDTAVLTASTYIGAAYGTTTLLQLIQSGSATGTFQIPLVSIEDCPDFEFRGLLVDVARQYHSIDNLKQMVRLCRFYKIRYLHFHLTDDQMWMFPTQAFPRLGLGEVNHGGSKPYTIEELKDLVAFAELHGVTLIPEYEVPGHSATSNRAYPDLFLIKGTLPYEHHASINFVKEDVIKAVDTIIGEMCEVFTPTPYFHIGGDEADLALAMQNEDFKKAVADTGLKDQYELYCRLLGQLNDMIKAKNKKMIVWEGFHRNNNPPVPKDIIVMAYEIVFYLPQHLVEDGYKVINASWTPLYVVNNTRRSPDEIYKWNIRQFKRFGAAADDDGFNLKDNTNLYGAHMCSWEQPEMLEMPSLRFRLPAMSERIWFDKAGKTFAEFQSRVLKTDAILDRLIHKMDVQVTNLTRPTIAQFDDSVTVTAKPSENTQGVIRYALDRAIPTATSPVFSEPMKLNESTDLTLQVFDRDDKPVGYPRWIRYEKGTMITDPNRSLKDQEPPQ